MPFLLRYTANIAGDIVFTGNTIGLSRSASTGVPGTVDSIGAYITTDTQERFGSFPVGTTNNFNLNNSAAVLRLPPGSEVLYAELVWAGTCIAGNSNLIAFIDNPVRLTTPQGAIIPVAPDPVTADTSSTILIDGVAYVRSANVTSIIQAGGAGEYAVGGIVATITVTEASTSNFGGWTLCVVYGNMSLTKVVSPGSALPGATVTYTITVMNTGNTVLTDIGVSDELLGLNDPFDLLEINEAKTYVIPFTVPLDAPLDSNIVNTSTAVSDTTEPVVATANLRIAAVPLALTLAKSVDRPLALPGETVLFTVTVANPEAQAISGIQLRDPLLGVNQALGTLAPGASLALPFTYDVPAGTAAGTTVVNTAFVASDQTNEIQASASFAVGGLPSGARLEKSFVPDVASPGQTVTAILTIFNTGNTDLTNVVLSDPLLGLSQQILILAAGASQTFAVPFPVPEQAAGTRIRNTAVLRTDQTGETTAEAELQVEPSIRVVLRKSASQSSALPGETVLYTVTLTNLSNAAITGVTVEDSLLGLIQTADTLPPGFAATVTLAFTVPDGYEAGTVLTNEAIVRANEIGEERAFSSITIGDAPVLRLRKLAFTRAAFPGQRIFFLIGGVNGGNVPLTDIGFDDPLLRLKGESALLGEGGAQFVLLPYVVPPGAPIGSAIVNTIVAGSDQIGEQTASVRIQIAEPPVAIEKAVARALLKTGETTEITLVVNNRRSIAAVDTVVADALARELTFVSGSVRVDDVPLPGADPNVGIPLGDILPGRSHVIRFRVEANFAPAGGKVANQAHAGFRLQEGGTLYGVDSNRVEIQIEEEEE